METPVEEHRHRQLNVRIGHQTTPWSLLADRFGIAFMYLNSPVRMYSAPVLVLELTCTHV